MLHVKRAGHSTLTTPDIGRMVDYFTRIVGLTLVAREKDRAILATKSGLEAIALETRRRCCRRPAPSVSDRAGQRP